MIPEIFSMTHDEYKNGELSRRLEKICRDYNLESGNIYIYKNTRVKFLQLVADIITRKFEVILSFEGILGEESIKVDFYDFEKEVFLK